MMNEGERGRRVALGLMAVLLLGTSGAALAQNRYGSTQFQSARYCRDGVDGTGNILAADVDCFSSLNPDQGRKDTRRAGGERVLVDSVSDMSIGGRLVSKVELGQLDLPTVKSGAWADDDTRVGSSIGTYMSFRFEGAEATPYALDAVIDWTSSGAPLRLAAIEAGVPGANDYGGEGYGGFSLYLVKASILPAFESVDQFGNFITSLACGTAGVMGTSFLDMDRPTAGYAEATLRFDTGCDGGQMILDPGENYALLTFKQTIAGRNGYMDATNTIRVKLSEALPEEVRQTLIESVVTARSVVPEPATWAMMIAGFGLVGAMARRRAATTA